MEEKREREKRLRQIKSVNLYELQILLISLDPVAQPLTALTELNNKKMEISEYLLTT